MWKPMHVIASIWGYWQLVKQYVWFVVRCISFTHSQTGRQSVVFFLFESSDYLTIVLISSVRLTVECYSCCSHVSLQLADIFSVQTSFRRAVSFCMLFLSQININIWNIYDTLMSNPHNVNTLIFLVRMSCQNRNVKLMSTHVKLCLIVLHVHTELEILIFKNMLLWSEGIAQTPLWGIWNVNHWPHLLHKSPSLTNFAELWWKSSLRRSKKEGSVY